ncbi:chromosome segregation protein SMC [Sansalvadorimonas sp. 2012CJ34-2]|uniref:Chromosome partition protein Smc n=1 Tax=Parendozoicomonas callyspongiae TaxID=2942213 RepID=A0ABT0PJU8_9GAMM|nr:chromosome segregation protein SMC [Sansalvadorimonas sp. 2012CJ34-2]MCL6271650.1 chromosome segregation protein SMC [Sansalvadorimonas sp. 2012CJ34-2]
MRLKCIKLAGFKSFVDPTTVYFPSNMCGVVGPNGCGKSNIIDAVRWVMGESSAKNLRGESITDVIFKGSNSRKPASYAQVELVFDNHEGRITGEYAAFNEISIKRRLTSDAANTYFLNGSKCRRKDIMDIFLGTGLGPRSYSIISQGIVSNLIESKPEELRVFIEEAAGISRYKERRRETENRIRRTNENLERLTDLREELERQLSHLKRQAEAAERYKNYKQEERLKKAQLHALRWQGVNTGAQAQESAIREFEIQLESAIAKQRSSDNDIEKLRQQQIELGDAFQIVQGKFYSTGNEITRLEQTITHRRERAGQLARDLQEVEQAAQENRQLLESDRQILSDLERELEDIEPELELAQAGEDEQGEALASAEDAMQKWQHEWDAFNQQASEPRRVAEVEQSKIQHLELALDRMAERLSRQKEEMAGLGGADFDDEIEPLREELTELDFQFEDIQMRQETIQESIRTMRETLKKQEQERSACSRLLNESRGRRASLEALQQAALDQGEGGLRWLQQKGLADQPRLAEQLQVTTGWETAVETVLGDTLQAVCVDQLDDIATGLAELEQASLTFLSGNHATASQPAGQLPWLGEYAQGTGDLLVGIYAADGLDQAMALRGQLKAGESIITRDGIWLGRDWLRVARETDASAGVLARKQELENLVTDLEALSEKEDTLADAIAQGREQLEMFEGQREECQHQVSSLSSRQSELKADLGARQAKQEQQNLRRNRLQEEIREADEQSLIEQESLSESRLRLQEALDRMEEDAERREELLLQRDDVRATLDRIRQLARHSKDTAHQLALRQQSLVSRRESLRQSVERLEKHSERHQERLEQLNMALNESDEPTDDLQMELEELLDQRLEIEEEMKESRRQLENVEHALREHEKGRSSAEQEAQSVRERLEKLRIDWQTLQVRRTTLQEQLQEDGYDLETVLANLPDNATESTWEEDLGRIEARIQRLGAINLAAIDEYDQQSERKKYLDAQNDDLEEALGTLEGAIRRIDRETRSRFKATFDRVDTGLRELFPKVFGGGQAYLELTGDDLLNTGVSIMAQPPGKKNSTIHLLSGGEKALTAIALVFAIFQLNPSPFCMLDEVDAPLDDANVGRYARMVEEMSEKVQFIYISHNKIAMEAANQLIGVTMHEPGVSRPVSVDIAQAAAMAAL